VCSQIYKKDDSKFVFHIWFIARFGWIFLFMNTTLVANQNSSENLKKQWSWLVLKGQICAKRLGRIWPGFGHHHKLPPEFSSRDHAWCMYIVYTKYFWDCMISTKGFRPRGHLISQLPYPKVSFIIKIVLKIVKWKKLRKYEVDMLKIIIIIIACILNNFTTHITIL
jgi:hypothetical protein